MELQRLTLSCPNPEPILEWYAEQFNLPTTLDGSVQIGRSRLRFVVGPASAAAHFAFHVPTSHFAQIARHMVDRLELTRLEDSETVARFDAWRAEAIYLRDPLGHIVELIAHDELAMPAELPPFPHLLGLAEVGLVVDDVAATVAALAERLGLAVFRGSASADFCALGGVGGRLIVVQRGREWYGSGGVAAAPLGLRIDLGAVEVVSDADGLLSLEFAAGQHESLLAAPAALAMAPNKAGETAELPVLALATDEAGGTAATPELAKIEAAAGGLLWPSESDRPIVAIHWPTLPTNAGDLLARLGLPEGTAVGEVALERAFAPLLAHHPEAAAFGALKAQLVALSDLRGYRCGEIEITLVFVGRAADGSAVGITTQLIET